MRDGSSSPLSLPAAKVNHKHQLLKGDPNFLSSCTQSRPDSAGDHPFCPETDPSQIPGDELDPMCVRASQSSELHCTWGHERAEPA